MEFTCLSGRKRTKSAVLEIFKRDKGVNRMYNILVCDDDREIVEAIEIYLSQEGYRILKAYDGIEALNILEKEKINLLIIDVMMPRLDGIRATLKIREKNSIPIIILSAKSERGRLCDEAIQPAGACSKSEVTAQKVQSARRLRAGRTGESL